MANVYVDSNAAGAGTGADWTNAYTTLAAALTAKAAGDDFWVAHNHAETQASAMTLTCPGTVASPCRIVCVNSAGSVPPVSADLRTTGSVTTTGNFGMTITGFAYVYGLTFNAGSGANNQGMTIISASTGFFFFDNCALKKLGTSSTTSAFKFGSSSAGRDRLILNNTPLTFGNVGDNVNIGSLDMIWRNTASAIGGSVPTTLFSSANNIGGQVLCEGVDLSAAGSGKTLVADYNSPRRFVFKDCALGASVTVQATQTNPASAESLVIISDSGATNYRSEKYSHCGNQTTETTIVRTGGASDGTTTIAWKIVTGANSKFYMPFESMPIFVWNDKTSANLTITVYGIWGGGAVPNNDDIWFEAEYFGSSATPIGSYKSCAKADVLATNAAHSSDSSTWGGSTTAFKMSATISSPQPALKGPVTIRIFAATASTTFYIDPKAVLS